MSKPISGKFNPPYRWLNCPRMGDIINDIFVPFKTPLDKKYESNIPPANRFSLTSLIAAKNAEKVGLIINLTKTDRYYNPYELKGVKKYEQIPCDGHCGPPSLKQVEQFIEACSYFSERNGNQFVGVHCTHGFNRTGFMIVSYLCEKCDLELDIAIELFAKARPPGIYKQDYLDELMKIYDYDKEKLVAPSLPSWDKEEKHEISNLTIHEDKKNVDYNKKPYESRTRKSPESSSNKIRRKHLDSELSGLSRNEINIENTTQDNTPSLTETCPVEIISDISNIPDEIINDLFETSISFPNEATHVETTPEKIINYIPISPEFIEKEITEKSFPTLDLEIEETIQPNIEENLTEEVSEYQESCPIPREDDTDGTLQSKISEMEITTPLPEIPPVPKPETKSFPRKIPKFMNGVNGVSIVTDPKLVEDVRQRIRDLMKVNKFGFVGTQPVSMTVNNIKLLKTKTYMVSWKPDGFRYVMVIIESNHVYMVDRENSVFKVENLYFPMSAKEHLTNTILDGEMIIDKQEDNNFPRFLIHDMMCINSVNVGIYVFTHRLHLIKSEIIAKRKTLLSPDIINEESFGVLMKDFWPITTTKKLWDGDFRDKLLHSMDGLIFQPSDPEDVYLPGQNPNLLKWKPPDLNSIDFFLKCEYVREKGKKSRYVGSLYSGGQSEPFGTVDPINRIPREKYNNKLVECTYNEISQTWEFLKERTDKSTPNYITVAKSIMESIKNPVNIDDIYEIIEKTSKKKNP